MGHPYSRPKTAQRSSIVVRDTNLLDGTETDDNDTELDIESIEDRKVIRDIKRDLNENPEIFVLNNVLMCTMFLKNYSAELKKAVDGMSQNQDLFWEPHTIVEKVNSHVIFRPMHGLHKDKTEPLVTRRIYVPMTDYLQVLNPMDDLADVPNESPKYRVRIEELERRGYVKLKRIDKKVEVSDKPDSPVASTSTTSDSESTTSAGTTENPELIRDHPDQGTLFDCFVSRKVKKPDIDLQLEELDVDQLTEDDVFDIVSYLSAKKFMKYIQNKVFSDKLLEALQIDPNQINLAAVDEHLPGKVFCDIRNDIGCLYPAELVPCLKINWPDTQTMDFMAARRELYRYAWPSDKMLEKMKKFDCVIVPRSSRRRGEHNRESELEWEIHFPLAEKYLELNLIPEQIKCYLVLLSLHKQYIQPHSKSFGIVPEHLMNLIFWHTETAFKSWPTHRLGYKLLELIEKFSNDLMNRKHRSYFVRNRNMFGNIKEKYLIFAHEEFHRIQQSPLTSILRALRNVHNINNACYEPLNYKELLDILYRKNWREDFQFFEAMSIGTNMTSKSVKFDSTPTFSDAIKQLKYNKEKKKQLEKLKKFEKQPTNTPIRTSRYNVPNEDRRNSVDSVQDDWQCEDSFEPAKKTALLKLFTNSYINLATSCHGFGSQKQARFFAKQAYYLTKILEDENPLFKDNFQDTFKRIGFLERRIYKAMKFNKKDHDDLDDKPNEFNSYYREVEKEINKLDDVRIKRKNGFSSKDIGQLFSTNIHQQLRGAKINLNTLSNNYNRSQSWD